MSDKEVVLTLARVVAEKKAKAWEAYDEVTRLMPKRDDIQLASSGDLDNFVSQLYPDMPPQGDALLEELRSRAGNGYEPYDPKPLRFKDETFARIRKANRLRNALETTVLHMVPEILEMLDKQPPEVIEEVIQILPPSALRDAAARKLEATSHPTATP